MIGGGGGGGGPDPHPTPPPPPPAHGPSRHTPSALSPCPQAHPWFRGVDWAAVAARSPAAGPPPIRPPVRHPADTANFDDYSGLAPQEHAFALSRAEQALFADF